MKMLKKSAWFLEGINALSVALKRSKQYGVELPIIYVVDAVINHNTDAAKTVATHMRQENKIELTSSTLDINFKSFF